MFDYFYNEIFRSVIIGFGSLFNGIEIKHKDSSDDVYSIIKVPLAYGPTQKFLARLEQEADLNRPVQMTLPRMSFEFIDLQYDPIRKATQTQAFYVVTDNGEKVKKTFMPVPYNMTIELSIMTKLNDDMLQIVEQILPYFQPAYTLPIKFLGELSEVQNVPIQIESISMEDDYEGNFDTRRALVYTLRFTAKTMLYGPVSDVTGEIVKKVQIGYIAGNRKTSTGSFTRDVSYRVEPRATVDYDNSVLTQLAANVEIDDTVIEVSNAAAITVGSYVDIDGESMYIKDKSGDKFTVRRAQDNTKAAIHASGASINSITKADASFIDSGDNFGFDGSTF
tara:strand:- start:7675 stop:8682 length:1008 start_codon:yes stop_codon:yes gene_type:complete